MTVVIRSGYRALMVIYKYEFYRTKFFLYVPSVPVYIEINKFN